MSFISTRKLVKWLFILLIPFVILSLMMAFFEGLVRVFPFFAMPECGGEYFNNNFDEFVNKGVISFIIADTVVNFVFFILMFMTRNVKDEFAINRELRTMTLFRFTTSLLYLTSIVFFPTSTFTIMGCPEYFQVILCTGLLFDSSIRQILRTFQPNPIVPFPMNDECIDNLESALIMPTSSRFFYNFLVNELQDENSLTLFALYADLRRYNALCEDDNTLEKDKMQTAKGIYADYILGEATMFSLPPNEIVMDLRRGMSKEG